ncbi:MAG: 2'-5' RNA ligase family protein [Chthoniobacterales bacterium]
MSTNEEMVAFWLLPAQKEREFFSSVIRELAARFDAPIFEPHVTLFGGAMSPERAARVLEALPPSGSCRLEIERVAFSPQFTKTLFVQFYASPETEELSRRIAETTESKSGYRFDPHLSLIYAALSEVEKMELARTIAVPFEAVMFDSLRTIVCPARIEERADVEGWRILGERRI